MQHSYCGSRAPVLILACWLIRLDNPVLASMCHAKLESGLAGEDEGVLSLLHAHAKRKVGQASLGAGGNVEVRSKVPDRREAAVASQVLEEAAMAAVALAVAEETAAAKAIGGGSDGRLLASSRLSDTNLLEDDEEKAVEQQVERATRLAGSVDLMRSGPAGLPVQGRIGEPGGPYQSQFEGSNKARPSSQNKTNNPFASYSNWSNPFFNPYFNPFASNPFAISAGLPASKDSREHWYRGVVVQVIIGSVVFVIAAGAFSMCCGFEEDFEGSDSNSSEEESSDGLFGWGGRRRKAKNHIGMVDTVTRPERAKGRNCCCSLFNCMCCCSWRMYKFMAIALICTIIGGYILWQAGILQPLLAQLLLYAYIVILVISFVVVLFWELIAGLTTNLDKVGRTVGKFGDGFSLFGNSRGRNTVGERMLNPRY
eukprot:TRINITY_DN62741_c0_g1_i1.p1 TRINITY_DN62741_c0_g1~~TRINITY_DN62741_c0_g1_i1.p1  ORF type:complete len:426 (-),score=56.78 TRINITY_DN62741_c0_g1_i1:45-1322(-)